MAGKLPNGGLRSYASMTYAGLKSMIHAGVGPDDPRVKAAVEWLRKHYSLDENPGMGKSGLYYYYHTFAKALDAIEARHVQRRVGQAALVAGGTGRRAVGPAEARRIVDQRRCRGGWKATRTS